MSISGTETNDYHSSGAGLPAEVGEENAEEALNPSEEIDQLLYEDESRLGDIYRLHYVDGLTPQEVAERLDVATPAFVYAYRAFIDAMREGKYTPSVHRLKQARGTIRGLLKRNASALSPGGKELLRQRITEIERRIDSSERQAAELDLPEESEDDARDLAILEGKPGIYAFSYGWYLENPVDPNLNTTLIKVGRAQDMGQRIREHKRGARAHIPEPLVVVRAFSATNIDLVELERHFHRLLNAAGHDNPRREVVKRSEVGREWFLTNERFLDAIASALKLRTEFIGQSEFIE